MKPFVSAAVLALMAATAAFATPADKAMIDQAQAALNAASVQVSLPAELTQEQVAAIMAILDGDQETAAMTDQVTAVLAE